MKKVREEKTSLTPSQQELLPVIDFMDTFSTTNHINSLEELAYMLFDTTPGWVKALFKVRNKLAGLVGLNNKMPADHKEKFEVGGYVSFFKILAIHEDEIILGANESHLNFRAIIKNDHSDSFNIKFITLVEFNNFMGRVYMKIVAPFHRLVVKRLVRNAYSSQRK